MATFQVGRCELGEAPGQLDQDGDRLAVSGWFQGSTLVEAKVIRQQCLGLNEESVVPLVLAHDSDFDGFYRVLRASVTPIVGTSYEYFAFQYSLDLQRVGQGYAGAISEIVATADDRDNTNRAPATESDIYVPQDWLHQTLGNVSARQRATEDGGVEGVAFVNATANGTPTYSVLPSDHYMGSARIECQVSGTWYELVGRQMPALSTVADVRISNGLIRCVFEADGDVVLTVWGGAAYEVVGTFNLKSSGTDTISPRAAPTVVRNDISTVTLRVPTQYGVSPTNFTRYVDISIRRGQMYVSGSWLAIGGYWSLGAKATTATTALTGGMYQTANGTDGHRWIIGSPAVWVADTTNGLIEITSGPSETDLDFFLGCELDGSSAATGDAAADVVAQYWEAIAETPRVISP